MGNLSKIRDDARSFLGRSWGKTKHLLANVKGSIDAGVGIYQNLKPIIDEGVQAFGNARVKDFNQKAQREIESHTKKGQQFVSEMTSHVDKIDDLSNRAFTTFA